MCCAGILLLIGGLFYTPLFEGNSTVPLNAVIEDFGQRPTEGASSEIVCDVKIKNPSKKAIRICGGQLEWCSLDGCFKVITDLPVIIPPNEEAMIKVLILPRGEVTAENEITLFVDGEELEGLTPIKVRLPAMSHKAP